MTARPPIGRPSYSSGRAAVRVTLATAVSIGLVTVVSGCLGPWLVGRGERGSVVFSTGELRSTEPTALDALDQACAHAVDRLGYEDVATDREADRIRWRARTASGDPVEIALLARGPEATELRIRIGISGNEAKSRLVLEQIHQAR